MKVLHWAVVPVLAASAAFSSAHAMDEVVVVPGMAPAGQPSEASDSTILSLGTLGFTPQSASRYDLDLNLSASGAVLDFYPFGNGVRFSAGVHVQPESGRQGERSAPRSLNSLVHGLAPAAEVTQGGSYLGSVGFGLGHKLGERLHLGVGAGIAIGSERGQDRDEAEIGRLEEETQSLDLAPAVGLTIDYRF